MSDSKPQAGPPVCNFVGRYRLRVEAKGRVTLPAPCRRALPDPTEPIFMVRAAPDTPCIQLIPAQEFRQAAEQFVGLSSGDAETRARRRRKTFSSVEEITADQKGRFGIDPSLLRKIGVEDEVLIVGVNRILELWKPETFTAELSEDEHVADELDDLLYG